MPAKKKAVSKQPDVVKIIEEKTAEDYETSEEGFHSLDLAQDSKFPFNISPAYEEFFRKHQALKDDTFYHIVGNWAYATVHDGARRVVAMQKYNLSNQDMLDGIEVAQEITDELDKFGLWRALAKYFKEQIKGDKQTAAKQKAKDTDAEQKEIIKAQKKEIADLKKEVARLNKDMAKLK